MHDVINWQIIGNVRKEKYTEKLIQTLILYIVDINTDATANLAHLKLMQSLLQRTKYHLYNFAIKNRTCVLIKFTNITSDYNAKPEHNVYS